MPRDLPEDVIGHILGFLEDTERERICDGDPLLSRINDLEPANNVVVFFGLNQCIQSNALRILRNARSLTLYCRPFQSLGPLMGRRIYFSGFYGPYNVSCPRALEIILDSCDSKFVESFCESNRNVLYKFVTTNMDLDWSHLEGLRAQDLTCLSLIQGIPPLSLCETLQTVRFLRSDVDTVLPASHGFEHLFQLEKLILEIPWSIEALLAEKVYSNVKYFGSNRNRSLIGLYVPELVQKLGRAFPAVEELSFQACNFTESDLDAVWTWFHMNSSLKRLHLHNNATLAIARSPKLHQRLEGFYALHLHLLSRESHVWWTSISALKHLKQLEFAVLSQSDYDTFLKILPQLDHARLDISGLTFDIVDSTLVPPHKCSIEFLVSLLQKSTLSRLLSQKFPMAILRTLTYD